MSCGCWRDAPGRPAPFCEVNVLFPSPWLGMFQPHLLRALKGSVETVVPGSEVTVATRTGCLNRVSGGGGAGRGRGGRRTEAPLGAGKRGARLSGWAVGETGARVTVPRRQPR